MTEKDSRIRDAFALGRCLVGPWALLAVAAILFLALLGLGPRALAALVLPFLAAVVVSFILLSRHKSQASVDESLLVLARHLHKTGVEGGETTVDDLASILALPAPEVGSLLEELAALAHVTFFWNRESGRIIVPVLSGVQLHCPHCAADLPLEAKSGRCTNCRCFFARNQPAKPYYHI